MKRNMFPYIIAVLLMLPLTGCNQHMTQRLSPVPENNLEEEYDTREKCGKNAETWFKAYQQNYPSDKLAFKNHYNKKMNKWFIYITSLQSGGYQTLSLTEVNENRKYGSCVGTLGEEDDFLCNFLGRDVKGQKDWGLLIQPYMEE